MFALIFVLFMIFFAITLFSKQPWSLQLIIIALVLVLAVISNTVWNSSKRDFTLLNLSLAACLLGIEAGFLVNLVRAGSLQFSFDRANSSKWLFVALAIFWLMWGAGALGYASASNDAVGYVRGEDAWTLYNKGNESVAAAILYFSVGISLLLAAGIKSAITKKGFRFAYGYFVEWKQVESYTWQEHKLTIYLKTSLLPRWLRRNSLIIKPADRDEIDRLLMQYLPSKQAQLSSPAQATA